MDCTRRYNMGVLPITLLKTVTKLFSSCIYEDKSCMLFNAA